VTRQKLLLPFVASLLLLGTGCGTFMAHRMVQSPNTYPTWIAPEAPVLLVFSPNFLTNFPREYLDVGPPSARICYRVINPGEYQLQESVTNWSELGLKRTQFDFRTVLPGQTNEWTAAPRGTVILLHGYALAQFSMAPWAIRLAEAGWRCVLVDLRGHGQSTGRRIYYGTQETRDLSQLLDQLERDGKLTGPVAVFGESYGAALALRWKPLEPRVRTVIAITPYASLSNAVINLGEQYAGWLPKYFLRAGLKKLPVVLQTPAANLDTKTVLARHPERALFVAAGGDKITPPSDVEQLSALAAPGSELIMLPDATHETATYYFNDLVPPVLSWLTNETGRRTGR
jgi:pimeloyl-ACP methyl ester carboxylesterase